MLAAALALLLAGDGGVAQAQTPQPLVGNLGRLEATANINLSADDAAQEFETGGNETGYTLSSIDLNLAGTSQLPTVKVFSGSATGTEVAALTAPSPEAGRRNYTYTAPTGITLAKETSYWVVAEGGDAYWYRAQTTEDASPAAGWSIADNAQSRTKDSTVSFASGGNPMAIRVNGTIINPDTVGPTAESATVNGRELVITFNEPLGAAASLLSSVFSGKKTPMSSSETALTFTSDAPSIAGNKVTLTLASASSVVGTDENVKVTYTKPMTGTANKVVDLSGNEADAFTDQPVANLLADSVPPTLGANDAVLNPDGLTLTLTYSEALKTSSVPDKSVFTVERTPAGGSEETVNLAAANAVAVSGSVVTLNLATPVAHNDGSLKVSYTKPSSGSVIEDATGNDAAAFMDQAVTNDSIVPRVSIEAVYPDVSSLIALPVVRVTRSNIGADPLSVRLDITQDDNYASNVDTGFSIPAGDTSVETEIPDLDYPGNMDGTMTFTVAASQNYAPALAPNNAATMEFKAPASGLPLSVRHDQPSWTVDEGDTANPTVTFTWAPGLAAPRDRVTIDLTMESEGADAGYDFVAFSSPEPEAEALPGDWVTAPGGGMTQTVTISIKTLQDTEVESNETIHLDFSMDNTLDAVDIPLTGADNRTTVSILDDDPLVVTGVAVASTPTGGYYSVGDTIEFTVTFNEYVTAEGGPQFEFELGGATRQAVGGDSEEEMNVTFQYTVAVGDADDRDGISWGANALSLNGGSIALLGKGDLIPRNADPAHAAQAALPAHKVDTAKPSLVSAEVDGTTLTLTFSEALNTTAPANTQFSVKVDGGAGANPTAVSIADRDVTLTLAAAVTRAQTATVTYAKPASNPIKDLSGKEADAFTDQAVTNLLDDSTPPTLGTGASDAVLAADGLTLTLTYNEALKTSSVPDKSVFTVERTPAGGSEETVNLAAANAVAVSGSVVTLKLATPVAHNDGSLKVSYEKPGSGSVIEDAAGNDAASFMDQTVTNDSIVPRVSIAADHADASPLFAHAEFTVTRSNTGTELDVAIAITQADTYLGSTTQTITIPGGDTTATASFPSDYAGNISGDLTATVAPSQSYATAIAPGNAATVRMKLPASGKTLIYSHQQAEYTVTEGATSVPVAFTLRTGEGVARPRQTISLGYAFLPDTALETTDYLGFGRAVNIETDVWAADGTAFRATAPGKVDIVDDSRHEGSEQFQLDVALVADRLSLDPAVFAPTCPPGIAVGNDCHVTVTIIDDDPPTVQSVVVSSTPTGGYYGASDTISFTVNFNGAVTVTSTPQFTFGLGGGSRQAAYASGSDSTDLVFSYTVATADDDQDGISWGANGLGLNGGTIKFMDPHPDQQLAAGLAHVAQGALPAHKVDAAKPLPVSAEVQADGTTLRLTFNEALKTSSVPDKSTFTVERTPAGGSEETVNLAAANAVAVSGSVVTLKLATPVAHNDGSLKVSYEKPGSGSVIEDAIGNDAASFMETVTNDSTAPRVSIVAVYPDASPLFAHAEFRVTRSNTATDPLAVALTITQTDTYLDSTTRTITIPGGDTEATTSFVSDYAGNTSGDLTATVAPSQSYATGNAATVRMKVPASGKTLIVSHQQEAYTVTEGDSVNVTISLRTGDGAARPRNDVRFFYVHAGNTAETPADYTGPQGMSTVAPAAWTAAGTAFTAAEQLVYQAVADSPYEGSETFEVHLSGDDPPRLYAPTCPPGFPGSSSRCLVTVTITDRYPLAVQSVAVTSTPVGGYYGATNRIRFTVNFNGAVTVTSTPQFTFELGGVSRQAAYMSGSDSTDLVFSYTVATGDDDHDGISWGANALGLNSGSIKFTGNFFSTAADKVDANLDHDELAALPAHKVDTTKPLLVSQSADGTTLTLSFSEELNTTAPAATAFTVKVDGGGGVNPTDVSVSGSVVTLTLADAVTPGQMVTVTYEKPGTNNIQDLSGKEADAFMDAVVATAPPVEVEVSFARGSYTVLEAGAGTVAVTVNLDVAPGRMVVIPIVATGQAGAGTTDYSFPSAVTFASGVTQQMLDFAATDDDDDDDGESVRLAFGALPIGVSAGARTETTVNITDDDDPAVTVSFATDSYNVPEGGMVTVTVELSADPERMVVIPLTAMERDGATAPGGTGPDYEAPPASVTFLSGGQTSMTFSFSATQDPDDDDGESVLLGFGTMPDSRVTAGATPTATVNITDDDDPGVTVSRPALSVVQGRTATYTLVLATRPTGAVTVTPTSDTLAVVTVSPADLTFQPADWDVAQTVTVEAAAGSAGETATISHSVSGYGTITTAPDVDVTVTVAPPPTVSFGGGGGGRGPTPSDLDFEWTVTRDVEELDSGHDTPTGMWSDGATLFIAQNGSGTDDAVYAYDLESGERVAEREFDLADTNRAPRGIWSDGETAWVSDSGRERLFAYNATSGERDEDREFELAGRNRDARGIWSDGETMWVLDGRKNALFGYDLASAAPLGEFELVSANDDPRGIWSDGVTVWVSDHGAKRLLAYRLPAAPDAPAAEDAEPVALERVRDEEFDKLSRASNNSPRGIWSDGAVMYVADASDGKVYSYNMPDAIDARLASLTLSGVEIGEFDARRTEYEGVPAEGVTQTTVEAEAAQSGATAVIDSPDANPDTEGHQVTLAGTAGIAVTVTSQDGSRTRVYRVRLAEAGPSASCLRGAVGVGFSLVTYEGGRVEELVACAESRGVTALYTLSGGAYVSYIVGAPEPVNVGFGGPFADGVPALTPLTVRSESPATAAPAAPAVTEPFAVCLRGEVAAGFSLLVYEGGGIEDLEACAASRDIAALYALVDGEYVSYILGAPELVNAAFRALFPDGVPPVTPLIAKSGGPSADATE